MRRIGDYLTTKVNRHHIRGTFYHTGLVMYLLGTMYLWDIIDWTNPYTIATNVLIIVDYFAEMYDPNPDNPGTWFERHFHRFFDDES